MDSGNYYSGQVDWVAGKPLPERVEIVRHPNVKPGDLIPLEIKVYGLKPDSFLISRLRVLKQRRASEKYSVIVWCRGYQETVKHITKAKFKKYVEMFNLVEE